MEFKVLCLGIYPSFFSKKDELAGQGQTRRKEEACNTFVLSAITSMCTYNVCEVKHWVVRKLEICPSLLFFLFPFPSSLFFHFLPMKFGVGLGVSL